MGKILVILTGGTIGSKIGETAINVNPAAAYHLIKLYQETYGEDTAFEVIQPLNVLSENMTPEEWTKLLQVLETIDFSNYQGIVITHGSDTLAYTSALIGMMYGGKTSIPMVMIAANYALEDPRSNGLRNFRGAVRFIETAGIGGVFTIYADQEGIVQVYLSTRLVEADCYEDQFRSFGGKSFGRMEKEQFVANAAVYQKEDSNLAIKVDDLQHAEVLLIRSYPALNYDNYQWDEKIGHKPKAILVSLYHSATACVSEAGNKQYSLAEFTRRCKKEGIDVYGCSFKSADMKFYASSKAFLEAGLIPMCNISVEAAYMKLLLIYNDMQVLSENDEIVRKQYIERLLNQNLFFEHLPEL